VSNKNRFTFFFLLFLIALPSLVSAKAINVVTTPAVSTDGSFTVSWMDDMQPDESCLYYYVDVKRAGYSGYYDYKETADCRTTTFAASGYPDGEYEAIVTTEYIRQDLNTGEFIYEYATADPVEVIVNRGFAEECRGGGSYGYQIINVGGDKTESSIAVDYDDWFDYFFVVTVDGLDHYVTGMTIPHSPTTYGSLVSAINNRLSMSNAGATAQMADGNIKIVSHSRGAGSSILISRFGEEDSDIRPVLNGYVGLEAPVSGTGTPSDCGVPAPPAPEIKDVPSGVNSRIDDASPLPATFNVNQRGPQRNLWV